jgi:hypothetical protein
MLPIGWNRSVSFTSAIFRTIKDQGLSDWIATALLVCALAIVIGAIAFVARRHGVRLFVPGDTEVDETRGAQVTLEWAALIVVALVFSPQIMARHMLLLTLVYIVALGIFCAQRRTGPRVVLITAIVLTVAGLSFPFGAFGLDDVLQSWRAVAGASWCALLLILAVTWAGAVTISAAGRRPPTRSSSDVGSTPS